MFQIYFTGAGGDVAMGKYNDGSPEAEEIVKTALRRLLEVEASSAGG